MSIVSPNGKPAVHLICNAHLDPVWQWRWEEGASEALATFRNAADILEEHPELVFCHNEAVLYRWVERLDPALFRRIRVLIAGGRWAVSGGWFIQPDLNLPGTESLIRHIAEGRRYFQDAFGAAPRVAYNFDSFGHGAGLPQILRLAGYEMYIHMRPQSGELALPADLYRWRGADGTEIPAYRISVGLYHTERDNIEARLRAGVAQALELGRDVPVFWGLGNHGGGATREDLRKIDRFRTRERRVRILHSTPDLFFAAVRAAAGAAPVFEGGLERVFTGCYTSLSRLKRRAAASLAGLAQSEALAAAAWWLRGREFPGDELEEAWRLHLFNDFHDIITGSCVEPAEHDALDMYGRAEDAARRIRLGAAAALAGIGSHGPPLPLVVLISNPSLPRGPVEFECMADYRPFWKGKWHLRLFRADGSEVVCQEEQPEALLPFNDWRRRLSFIDDLPGVGAARYELRAFEGPAPKNTRMGRRRGEDAGRRAPRGLNATPPSSASSIAPPAVRISRESGLLRSLVTPDGLECLAGLLFEPLVVEDTGDSWGTGCGSYRKIVGRFRARQPSVVAARGPVRTIRQSVLFFRKSRIVMDAYSYPDWPALEFRLRITWNEERRRLKLRIPTAFAGAAVLCEVPGAAVRRPADGEERVHGRWLLVEGKRDGRAAALGIADNGQHGFDFKDGEVRLSVLRSAAYCHERGFRIGEVPARKFSDVGVHDVRFLVTAGTPDAVRALLPGLADHLNAPPAAYAHLPFGRKQGDRAELLSLSPSCIRLLACKPAWDGAALVVRLQETVGRPTGARLVVAPRAARKRVDILLAFEPFEIKTIRIERSGAWREADLIDER
jgi:alpha-mannosidase